MQVSHEHYLKAIYILQTQTKYVKQAHISRFMNYSRPSVYRAVYLLKDENLVYIDEKNHIILTESGCKLAKEIIEKHNFFKEFFMSAGIDEKNADFVACNLEHVISYSNYDLLKKYITSHVI